MAEQMEYMMYEQFPMGGVQEVKRTLCKFHQEGKCDKGDHCTYAHDESEIGQPIYTGNEAAFGQAVKRTICQFWEAGTCGKGSACTYAHGEEEFGTPIMDPTASEIKRTVCKFWQEGKCEKGPGACTFAHGEHEIGEVVHVPMAKKYGMYGGGPAKRTLCKFWMEGSCEKGRLCGFAHGQNQIGMPYAENMMYYMPQVPASATKRNICKFWQENVCEKGNACTFAHGAAQIGRVIPGMLDGTAETMRTSIGRGSPLAEGVAFEDTKRTICKFWMENLCDKESRCTFAHGEHELGSQIEEGLERPENKSGQKRSMCKFFLESVCERGDACTFAHGPEDIGQPIVIDENAEPPLPDTVKRTICKFYQEGRCEKTTCTFAHSEEEIGEPISAQANAYRRSPAATICKFWLEGVCKAGVVCTFAHGMTHSNAATMMAPPAAKPQLIYKPATPGAGGKGSCGIAYQDYEIGGGLATKRQRLV